MAMNVDYKGVEIGQLPVNGTTVPTFVAGRAVFVNPNNAVAGTVDSNISAASRVLGIVKENFISGVINEITGQFGIYGSGKASVLLRGVATVRQSVYSGTSYNVYDQTRTYAVNDDLYATPATGVLTNVAQAGAGPNGITSIRVGRVLIAPNNPANGDPMTITVETA
jgi:hypothetical protein